MTIYEMFGRMTGGELVLLIILFFLIQISPLKLNPWDNVFGWIGKKVNSKIQDELKELRKQVSDLWITAHRQSILTFARECRAQIDHDAEEWKHILSAADEYEQYCIRNTISNGVVKADTKYVRDLYQ